MTLGLQSIVVDPHLVRKLLPFLILDIVLRGISLWRSAKKSEKWWFISLLVVNSLGILPGIYLLTHREDTKAKLNKKLK